MKTTFEKTCLLAKNSSIFAKGLLAAISFLLAAGLTLESLAQVNITFQNRGTGALGPFAWPIYLPEPSDGFVEIHGNTPTGAPPGTQSYGGALVSGLGYTAQLWIGPPTSTEETLTFVVATGFQTGGNAGFIAPVTISSAIVQPGVAFAWQARVWDNRANTITTWAQVLADPSIRRGKSPVFVSSTTISPSPTADGRSFNLHFDATPRVTWLTMDGGGAFNSVGGNFRVSGTIGQPDAGRLTSAAFDVAGGFWSSTLPIYPRLRITLNGPNVLLTWPDPSAGFQLEATAGLPATAGSWSTVGQVPTVVGAEKRVTVPHNANGQYYRLARP